MIPFVYFGRQNGRRYWRVEWRPLDVFDLFIIAVSLAVGWWLS